METFVIILCVFALWHFIYEAVILPSILCNLKFKLEKLKDKTISLVIVEKEKIEPMDFNLAMLNIEASSKNLVDVSFVKIIKGMFFIKKNPNIIKKFNKIEKEHSSNAKLIKIKQESVNYVSYALLANSFMLILYLFPLIILAFILIAVFGKSKKTYRYIKKSYELESNVEEIPSNGYCLT